MMNIDGDRRFHHHSSKYCDTRTGRRSICNRYATLILYRLNLLGLNVFIGITDSKVSGSRQRCVYEEDTLDYDYSFYITHRVAFRGRASHERKNLVEPVPTAEAP